MQLGHLATFVGIECDGGDPGAFNMREGAAVRMLANAFRELGVDAEPAGRGRQALIRAWFSQYNYRRGVAAVGPVLVDRQCPLDDVHCGTVEQRNQCRLSVKASRSISAQKRRQAVGTAERLASAGLIISASRQPGLARLTPPVGHSAAA